MLVDPFVSSSTGNSVLKLPLQQQQSDAMPSNDTQHTEPQQSNQQTRRLPLSDIVDLIDTPSPKETPKTNSRTIPEDPQTRKLFIQEVRHRV